MFKKWPPLFFLVLSLVVTMLGVVWLGWHIEDFWIALGVLCIVMLGWLWAFHMLALWIQDRERMHGDLQTRHEALMRSHEELEQYAHVISHDLQAPLRQISGFVEILHEKTKHNQDASIQRSLGDIQEASRRLQKFISDLLLYARLEHGAHTITGVDMNQLMDKILKNNALEIDRSRASVSWDPLPFVRAEPTHLIQLFDNLIQNSIKYRSRGAPQIHIAAEDKGSHWCFLCRDNGIGIAPEHHDRVFDIFKRLHTEKEYPGTGIGLAICKKIVTHYGGKIWIDSDVQEGLTIKFTIPKDLSLE